MPKSKSQQPLTKSGKRVESVKFRKGRIDITRDQFHALVKKAAQPVKSDSASDETSESHPSDDYTETNTH